MRLDPLALVQFLAVYRHGSINKACRDLGVSQPGLSKGIRRLEDMLGVTLFERHAAGMSPTPYGESLAGHARVVEEELRRARDDIDHMRRSVLGSVRLGLAPAAAAHAMPDILAALALRHPGLTVTVFEGLFEHLAARVAANDLEMAFTTLPLGGLAPMLQAQLLYRDRFIVAAGSGHPLAGSGAPIPISALLEHPWILPPRDGQLWQRVVDLFAGQGLQPPEPRIETNSTSFIKAVLRGGRFLTFVPRRLIAHEEQRGEISVLGSAGLSIERDVILLRRQNSVLSPAANAVVEAFDAAWVFEPARGPAMAENSLGEVSQ